MAKKKPIFSLPVSWGNVSIGKKTIRLSAETSRLNLKLHEADKSLCDQRLTGKIVSRAADAQPEQGSLPGPTTTSRSKAFTTSRRSNSTKTRSFSA